MKNCFTDSTGREWAIVLNLANCGRVKRELRVDLASHNTTEVVGLSGDTFKLAAVLWTVCKDAADAAGVTRDQFDATLNGGALDAGFSALVEAVIEFAPTRARAAMREALERHLATVDRAAQAVIDKMNSPEFNAGIDSMVAAQVAKLDEIVWAKA